MSLKDHYFFAARVCEDNIDSLIIPTICSSRFEGIILLDVKKCNRKPSCECATPR